MEIAARGATLVGDRWNGAGATIVLLHAGVCDRRCWREVGARLGAAGRDVVAYDRRGFGDVPPASGPFRHVDDLLAVLDALSPDAPAWLVGHLAREVGKSDIAVGLAVQFVEPDLDLLREHLLWHIEDDRGAAIEVRADLLMEGRLLS